MAALRIGLNGFGRIGRTFLRTLLQDARARERIEVAVINVGPVPLADPAVLFAYDSTFGAYPGVVSYENSHLVIDGYQIPIVAHATPADVAWGTYQVSWVVEASGKLVSKQASSAHLQAGAQAVLITAPCTDAEVTVIPGVNDAAFIAAKHRIVSLGSCTTNCFAPLVKVLHTSFGIQSGTMTTIHAYTNDQLLLDGVHKDPRRARAAACNIVPTKTGAAKVIDVLFPDLAGKLAAVAVRVPVCDVSLVDFTFMPAKSTAVNTVNQVLQQAAEAELKGIMAYTSLPLVSSDFIGNPASCIVDSLLTQATGQLIKVSAWYDNEWGYASRLKDFLCSCIS